MTAPSPNSFNPRELAQLTHLRLQARVIVEGYLTGLHRSPHQGYSVEFAEHREYAPGDDLRYVDWKVFGRSDRYYLKQFEEETNFACMLAVDASESMLYGSDPEAMTKFEYARLLAAVLASLVIRQQDAAGLVIFSEQLQHYARAAGNPQQQTRIWELLEQAQASGPTALGPMLHEVSDRFRKRGMILLCSDLFDDLDEIRLGLQRLKHRRHDIRVLQILDPAELEFPFEEPTLFHGLEISQDQMIDPRGIRQAYLEEFQSFLIESRRLCRDLGVEHDIIRTDEPFDRVLRRFLSDRPPQPIPDLLATPGGRA
ncbi:MAG: DUF58 domain-containing protein [Planctomycetaceae bacterium]|nr:DUF58 domain-containing protein [Planctomycetaceae bacterium]